jgi:hypothetical protein
MAPIVWKTSPWVRPWGVFGLMLAFVAYLAVKLVNG